MEKAFIAAIKRRDVKELVAQTLETEGKPEQAKEVRDASRLTYALIARTCIDEVETDIPEEVEEVEEVEAVETEDLLTVGDIKALIKNGKVKKAKAAFKAQFDKSHPNYKELKKLIKGAK